MPVDKAVDVFSVTPRRDIDISEEDADILKNKRRRELIKQLSIGPTPSAVQGLGLISMELSDLSERIAAVENRKIPEDLERSEKKTVYSTLYQSHLPRLEDEGWITYNSDTRIVRPQPIIREKSPEMMVIEGFLDGDNGFQEAALEYEEPRTDIHGTGTDLEVDHFYDALSNPRRRMALEYVSLNYGETDYQEISEMIAAVENEKFPSQLTSKERKNVLVQMYQNHLPKLDGYDIIEFDKRAQDEVQPGKHFHLVAPHLSEEIPREVLDDPYAVTEEDEESKYEAVIAAFSF